MCVSAVVIVASSSLLSHFVVAASSHVAVIILSIAVTQRHLSLMPSPIPIPNTPRPTTSSDYFDVVFVIGELKRMALIKGGGGGFGGTAYKAGLSSCGL